MDNETAQKLADAMNRLAEAIEKQPLVAGPTYIPTPYPYPAPQYPSWPQPYYPNPTWLNQPRGNTIAYTGGNG